MSKREMFYYIVETETDMPLAVVDTLKEAMQYIECSRTTLFRMLKYGASHNNMSVYAICE